MGSPALHWDSVVVTLGFQDVGVRALEGLRLQQLPELRSPEPSDGLGLFLKRDD